jgi:hypothetical protein
MPFGVRMAFNPRQGADFIFEFPEFSVTVISFA